MRRTRLVCVLGVTVWSAVVACSQTAAPSGALSEPLRTHLENERLGIVAAIRGLPLGVRDKLTELFGTGTLDIANPDETFRATATADPSLPLRRLVAAGCAIDHCLVYYERGGTTPARLVGLFHWTPDLTKVEWGGVAPTGLATIEDVKKAVLSGAIKGPIKAW